MKDEELDMLIANSEYEPQQLKDYITNLQEKLEISQTNEETYRLEMLDITKCLGLDEDTIFDEVKEKATNLQKENERLKERCEYLERSNNRREDEIMSLRDECVDGETYKSRCKKAIKYNYELQERYCHSALYDELVASKIYEISEKNIKLLNGGDEEC